MQSNDGIAKANQELRRIHGVSDIVLVATDMTGRHLVAFVVPTEMEFLSAAAIRTKLEPTLAGRILVDVIFASVLPQNPGDTIDYSKQRPSYLPDLRSGEFAAPITESERLLSRVWEDVFEAARIGRNDNFFDLGGDSLTAATIAALVHASTNVQLKFSAFVDNPTVAALARVLDRTEASHRVHGGPPSSSIPATRAPASFFQERIWNFSQTPETSAGYTVSKTYRVVGPLKLELFEQSIAYMANRHHILRSFYVATDEGLVQMLDPSAATTLCFSDLSTDPDPAQSATKRFVLESAWVFELAKPPLVRMTLLRLGEAEYRLLIICHHIICDALSWTIYLKELGLLYQARVNGLSPPLLPRAQPQYSDFSRWQRETYAHDTPAFERCIAWWKRSLERASDFKELPFKRPCKGSKIDFDEGRIKWKLASGLNERLNKLARSYSCTFFATRLSALVLLLANSGENSAAVIGTHVTSRNKTAFLDAFGFFSNLVTLVIAQPDQQIRLGEWVARVQAFMVEAEENSDIPYEMLAEELRVRGAKCPQISIIAGVSASLDFVDTDEVSITAFREENAARMPWGITFLFVQDRWEFDLKVLFDATLYDPLLVRRFIQRYERLLDLMSRFPEGPLRDIVATASSSAPDPIPCLTTA